MEITEVKVIPKEGPDKKLKAYATITLDNAFVVRNIKVIKGNKGLFVAMPSRKMREACPKCNYKNVVRSKFCNQCGGNLPVSNMASARPEIKQSEHRDIAHPITLECREYIQKTVLNAYKAEAKETGDVPEPKPKMKPSVEMPEKGGSVAPPPETHKKIEDTGDIEL